MVYGESKAIHAIKSKEKASAELERTLAEMVRRAMMLGEPRQAIKCYLNAIKDFYSCLATKSMVLKQVNP